MGMYVRRVVLTLTVQVKSMKVYAGNWALFSGMSFTGTEDRVKPGFTSHWLGIYAPVQGEPISLYSNDLSSLKPVGMSQC